MKIRKQLEQKIKLCRGCEWENDRENCPYNDLTLCPKNNEMIREQYLYSNRIIYGVKK